MSDIIDDLHLKQFEKFKVQFEEENDDENDDEDESEIEIVNEDEREIVDEDESEVVDEDESEVVNEDESEVENKNIVTNIKQILDTYFFDDSALQLLNMKNDFTNKQENEITYNLLKDHFRLLCEIDNEVKVKRTTYINLLSKIHSLK